MKFRLRVVRETRFRITESSAVLITVSLWSKLVFLLERANPSFQMRMD